MKTFIKVLIVLGILAIIIMLSANYFISKAIDRGSVVKVVEENLNTRFDLKEISIKNKYVVFFIMFALLLFLMFWLKSVAIPQGGYDFLDLVSCIFNFFN